MMYNYKAEQRSYRSRVNNAQGDLFEKMILSGCAQYEADERAKISKKPEPYRVLRKYGAGTFEGRFTGNADPDFHGCLKGGREICFEAKYTTTEKLQQSVLTEAQSETLEKKHRLGALCGVCCGIREAYFFLPWIVWDRMKELFGRKYVTAPELQRFRIKCTGVLLFLDYTSGERVEQIKKFNF